MCQRLAPRTPTSVIVATRRTHARMFGRGAEAVVELARGVAPAVFGDDAGARHPEINRALGFADTYALYDVRLPEADFRVVHDYLAMMAEGGDGGDGEAARLALWRALHPPADGCWLQPSGDAGYGDFDDVLDGAYYSVGASLYGAYVAVPTSE